MPTIADTALGKPDYLGDQETCLNATTILGGTQTSPPLASTLHRRFVVLNHTVLPVTSLFPRCISRHIGALSRTLGTCHRGKLERLSIALGSR
jgi:hypothetical protein